MGSQAEDTRLWDRGVVKTPQERRRGRGQEGLQERRNGSKTPTFI